MPVVIFLTVRHGKKPIQRVETSQLCLTESVNLRKRNLSGEYILEKKSLFKFSFISKFGQLYQNLLRGCDKACPKGGRVWMLGAGQESSFLPRAECLWK